MAESPDKSYLRIVMHETADRWLRHYAGSFRSDPEGASLDLLDHRQVVWAEVGRATYLLHQRYRYQYEGPVRDLRQRLVVIPPPVHGGQRRLEHQLTVVGCRARVATGADELGNHVVAVSAARVDDAVEFEAWAAVRCRGTDGFVRLPGAALADPRLLRPTMLTRPDRALAGVAGALAAGGGDALAVAERACSWTRQALSYEYGVTHVRTAAADALAGGRGVCQDYAHVMLAICRAAGVPARYVSGHLVGEGGSHAWVEVVVPDPDRPGEARAVALDPTHDRRAGWGYVTVAVGRDYADVAPTSGTYVGGSPGRLSASKRLGVVATDPAPALVGR
jgi:transglutaminase-like putative cysteine protease